MNSKKKQKKYLKKNRNEKFRFTKHIRCSKNGPKREQDRLSSRNKKSQINYLIYHLKEL